MARSIPSSRLERLIEVATETFIAEGYRRTQMADVAEALGVAKGTLYGYVESKAALFDAAIRCADGHEPLPAVGELPIKTPPAGATVKRLEDRIAEEASDLRPPNQGPMQLQSSAMCSSTCIGVPAGTASRSSSPIVARLTIPTLQACGSAGAAGRSTSS
jgi:AcrR family transcriptional regulator